MTDLQPLSALFRVSSGHQLSQSKLRPAPPGQLVVAYISRTHRRNGVDGWTALLPGLTPAPAGSITVCLRSRNHALASFVQPFPFYTSYHVAVLEPLTQMSVAEKLWWCKCIEQNRFRFNFGRQANRTLGSLLVPVEVPTGVKDVEMPTFAHGVATKVSFAIKDWPLINLTELFDLSSGRQTALRGMTPGPTPWVSGSAENNGITAHVDLAPEFEAGCLTVASNGSIGSAFYQPDAFTASSDVAILRPRFNMSVLSGLFICALLRKEAFRYNYARKWTIGRMQTTRIPLPLDSHGRPDTDVIEGIVRSSQYAALVDVTT